METPLISPLFVWFLDKVGFIYGVLTFVLAGGFLTFLAVFIGGINEPIINGSRIESAKTQIKVSLVGMGIFAALLFVLGLCPQKNTILKMYIAKRVTKANVIKLHDVIKRDLIDIFGK